jgi:hypothetical protein
LAGKQAYLPAKTAIASQNCDKGGQHCKVRRIAPFDELGFDEMSFDELKFDKLGFDELGFNEMSFDELRLFH